MKTRNKRNWNRILPSYWRRTALVAGLFALTIAGSGACINQPLVKARAPAAPAPIADAHRLERDVKQLVESFQPRGYRPTINLDRAAAFIGAELARAGGRVTEQSSPFKV